MLQAESSAQSPQSSFQLINNAHIADRIATLQQRNTIFKQRNFTIHNFILLLDF
jgi:hypothetical protein